MVDKLFGDFLVRYKEPVPVNEPEEPKEDEEQTPVEMTSPYEMVTVQEALGKAQYVIMFFTAEYCPPCVPVHAPLEALASKGNEGVHGDRVKFQVVVINCDKAEEQYTQCISKMPKDWYAMPFDAAEAIARVEDVA